MLQRAGKVGWVYRPDLAEATANALVANGLENKIYELSGTNLTQQQFVDTLSEELNKSIPFLEVDDTSYEEMLKATGVPDSYLPMLIMTQKSIRERWARIQKYRSRFLIRTSSYIIKPSTF